MNYLMPSFKKEITKRSHISDASCIEKEITSVMLSVRQEPFQHSLRGMQITCCKAKLMSLFNILKYPHFQQQFQLSGLLPGHPQHQPNVIIVGLLVLNIDETFATGHQATNLLASTVVIAGTTVSIKGKPPAISGGRGYTVNIVGIQERFYLQNGCDISDVISYFYGYSIIFFSLT